MKVIISGLFIYPKLVGGAENYVYNLLKGFSALGKESEFEIILQKQDVIVLLLQLQSSLA